MSNKIRKLGKLYIEFEIGKTYYKVYYPPLRIKFYIDNEIIEYPLVSERQYKSLMHELNIVRPEMIYIDNNNNYIHGTFNLTKYIEIYKTNSSICVFNNKNIITMLSEENVKILQQNDKKGFLNMVYDSPENFDKNYYLYFPTNDEIIMENFKIISTKGRIDFCEQVHDFLSSTEIVKFFGLPSIGKSFTLIGKLKYDIDHEFYGTLYINCQCLSYYFNSDLNVVKQIIIDEIVYLFFNEYKVYQECTQNIIDYKKENGHTFWDIIKIIIKYFNYNKYYKLSFDQYNEQVDPFNRIEDLMKLKKEKNLDRVEIMTVSSMNSDDIKIYKVKVLMKEETIYNKVIYNEIKNLVDPKLLQFNNLEINDKLDYLGRNIDNYNIFDCLIKQNKSIDNFITKRKKHIKERIKEYYGILNNMESTTFNNIIGFLSFSVYSKYTLLEFQKIFHNIPFEYFNIVTKKNKTKEENYIKIEYVYPVINEIIEEIYSSILFRKDISNILNSIALDGGGRGILFEKMVINHLTPGEHNNDQVCLFGEFLIEDVYFISKYIPKISEKANPNGYNIINIPKKPFLLKQKIFYGKALDIVIIDYRDDNHVDAYCFQITNYKKIKDLFTPATLIDNLMKFQKYMNNFFKFKISTIFFAYIFNYNNLNERKVKKMCQYCDKKNIKYIFFDINKMSFINKRGNKINVRNDLNQFNFIINSLQPNPNATFQLNDNQIKEIYNTINIIKKNNKGFKFFGTYDDIKKNIISSYELFFITELIIFDHNIKKITNKTIMGFKYNNEYKVLILNKFGKAESLNKFAYNINSLLNQNKFDYYKIID